MKSRIPYFVLALVATLSCSPKDTAPPTGPVSAAPPAKKSEAATSVDTSMAVSQGVATESGASFSGTLTFDSESGVPGAANRVDIAISSRGDVSGTMEIGDARLGVAGRSDDGDVRLWAASSDVAKTSVGGFLLGTASSSAMSGDFVLSSAGGASPVRGRFQLQKK